MYLILENGRVFEGKSIGTIEDKIGEVVFTTGMTGYLETLTDKSYFGQIIVQTFPLIGNYGVIPYDFENDSITATGYIVKHLCQVPSNFRSEGNLETFLKSEDITGLSDIDTRELTKIIRSKGVMNGMLTNRNPKEVDLNSIREYRIIDAVKSVTTKKKYTDNDEGKYKVAIFDFGAKDNIKRELIKRNCSVTIFPSYTRAEEIISYSPDGIMLTNGPGNPEENIEVIEELKLLLKEDIPMFGICLGHQLLALASGFKTHKLKYGHRGANQPAKDLTTGKIYITSQNHGYAVKSESIDESIAKEWFVNTNDNTCEGIKYIDKSVVTIQFHPEACGGPQDTMFLFDKFIEMMEGKICH